MLVADMFHLVGLYPHDPALISRGADTAGAAPMTTTSSSSSSNTPRGAAAAPSTAEETARGLSSAQARRNSRGGAAVVGDIDFVNPFAFGALSRMMAHQDAWRKNPSPRSIDLQPLVGAGASDCAALGVFTLLLTIEDELQRCVYTDACSVTDYFLSRISM
jgi:hypothetical protein